MAVIEHKWMAELEKQIQEAGGDVLTEQISADIAAQLEAGRQVAYTALPTQDALAVKRTAAGKDEADVSGFVLTEDGIVAKEAVITEQGMAARRLVATEEGVAGEGIIVTGEEAVAGAFVSTEGGTVAGRAVATPEEDASEEDDDAAEKA